MPSKPGRTNQVRLIGGELKRRLLDFPDQAGLRPTPDRVRETLFNWLGQDLTGMDCLDAFAGSGALGFEAVSRNAASVVMLEYSRIAFQALQRNKTQLKTDRVELVQADALGWMRSCTRMFDLIFLDPPFAAGLMSDAMEEAIGLLKPDGWIYVEQSGKLGAPEGFIIYREGQAGQSHFGLIKRTAC